MLVPATRGLRGAVNDCLRSHHHFSRDWPRDVSNDVSHARDFFPFRWRASGNDSHLFTRGKQSASDFPAKKAGPPGDDDRGTSDT